MSGLKNKCHLMTIRWLRLRYSGQWLKIMMQLAKKVPEMVNSTPLTSLKNLDGVEPVSRPKTVKSILKSKSTFKAEALKGVIINEPSSAPAKGGSPSRSVIQRPSERFFPPCTHCGRINHLFDDCFYYPLCRLCGSYDQDTNGHNGIISLEREIKPRNLQHVIKRCETCGSIVHNTTSHYDTEWFKSGEALQAKNTDALKSKKTGSSKANRSKTPTKGPDIQFLTCLCARYQAIPKESHLITVKRIFRKRTLSACQFLGGKLVYWSTKKQQFVAMSSVEAEYVAAAGCCANIL
nr:hypothetical protein [Tanacetum cinerariifolium]